MKLIIGLGNPGLEYASTKHNIGFAVIKAIAKESGIKLGQRLHFSLLGKGRYLGEDIILALPQTYMNLSGKATAELVKNYIKTLPDLLIICDDINLELGKIRLRKQGSSGGHKGLESIIHVLGSDNFARLRVGIATDVHRGDITGYVLSPFKRKEKRNVSHAVALAADAALCMLKEGADAAMAKFNKRRAGTS
jgi:peptidyl-tRNA hydrolase, PTH1 family